MPQPIAIAGAGRMGQALGRLLQLRGESVVAVASRTAARGTEAAAFIGTPAKPATYADLPNHADRILIAVPDDAIPGVATVLAAAGMRAGIALHTSGALGPEALSALSSAGASCGTLHPLQTVASPEEGVRVLPGVAFAIDGAPAAIAWAGQLAALLDGTPLHIPAASRPAYHAAAVMAGNYLMAVIATAVMLMKEAGVEEAIARRALAPLARTTLENTFRMGTTALTGPIARGDAETVRAHLAALAPCPAEIAALYRAAGLVTLSLARQNGLSEPQATAIHNLLQEGPSRA